ncbi:wax ester/triacylglycerol synthase family O-acyltransferase [Mycolicibacterium sp.]|uniref:wax ester/triacylglycerol synthase family O-acyltransferase n=1 Tax=Mycolicibacterium sp. TaxID=2320850 RepID=UPI0028B22C09|nr:wax ester/triacylglycerol synthase family O-acyltransferase [Mycolicibacterium sp.]
MEILDPLDSLMLAAEVVSSPMHVAALLVLSPPEGEDPEDYVKRIYEETLASSVEVDPRLRRMPHSGVDTGFMWAWRDVTERGGGLDLRHHVQRRTVAAEKGMDGLWEMVADLHALRLERSSPLWMAYLIDGLPDGRFAFYIKVHHIVVDGVAGLQMITSSLSPDPDERGMPPFFAAASPAPDATRPERRRPPILLSALRTLTETASAGVELTAKVVESQLSNVVNSLVTRSIVAPFSAPRTRFNVSLGPFRSVAGATLDRSRIQGVQEAAGVTGNDVVMTVIAGGLRGWLAERGELPDKSLVAICPVTVRGRGSAAADSHGNQFGLGLCPLGTDVENPAERLALIHDGMANVKQQVEEHGAGATVAAMGPAIGPTILLPMLPFDAKVPPSFNLPISNVPGPPEPMYFNGASVDEIFPISSIWDGMGLNVTVCSYAEQTGIGYVVDRDIVTNIETLIPFTEQALTDLEAAVGIKAGTRKRRR